MTTLDTFTSLVAGIIIFGILGNLAHVTGTDDIQKVVQGGAGLAFVSYPDAISKFEWAPQVFAGVFFFMLFVLGIGTNVGMTTCLMTALRDHMPSWTHWKVATGIAIVQFAIGLLYVTPGGQFLLNFVDFFGASFVAFFLAIAELLAFGWVYGVSRLCRDVDFMLGRKTGWYWRICWGLVSPGLMFAILLYNIWTLEPLLYNKTAYPTIAYGKRVDIVVTLSLNSFYCCEHCLPHIISLWLVHIGLGHSPVTCMGSVRRIQKESGHTVRENRDGLSTECRLGTVRFATV